MSSIFVAKTDIKEYLQDRDSIILYTALTDEPFWNGIFDPLEYFNQLYSEVSFFIEHASNYLSVKEHFLKLTLKDKQRYLLLHTLIVIVKRHFYNEDNYCGDHETMSISIIQKLYDEIDNKIFPFREELSPTVFEDPTFIPTSGKAFFVPYRKINRSILPYRDVPPFLDRKFNFSEVTKKLGELSHGDEKIKYLIEISTEYQHLGHEGFPIDKSVVKQYDLEIRKLERIGTVNNPNPEITPSNRLNDFSNAQVVLIFHYFYEYCKLKSVIIDKTTLAKFIHLVVGKRVTKIANSEFYKKLNKAPNFGSNKPLIQDLEVIKTLFQDVELSEIVELIETEIKTAHRKEN
ncbi:hypothetical protein [Mucilaginibacter flavidus]|uniref:hypothetical protein n=1 Tax=Mucilaginibacter flavidus TaxID=2949309 RepID=UPI002093A509|nr:hypothetical protein [Mucilaginibacter flavidus]MCO5948087.1 hypothetical protein [Mucilaginibacter flavidus]